MPGSSKSTCVPCGFHRLHVILVACWSVLPCSGAPNSHRRTCRSRVTSPICHRISPRQSARRTARAGAKPVEAVPKPPELGRTPRNVGGGGPAAERAGPGQRAEQAAKPSGKSARRTSAREKRPRPTRPCRRSGTQARRGRIEAQADEEKRGARPRRLSEAQGGRAGAGDREAKAGGTRG